jgi:AbrB family looped-hinge helix DNA binding protein
MNKDLGKRFFGITTIGGKGQVVIPAEARAALKLVKGEKLMVVSPNKNVIVLAKASELEAFASQLSKRLASMKKIIKK